MMPICPRTKLSTLPDTDQTESFGVIHKLFCLSFKVWNCWGTWSGCESACSDSKSGTRQRECIAENTSQVVDPTECDGKAEDTRSCEEICGLGTFKLQIYQLL